MANQSLMTFTLHGLNLAIDVRAVKEIIWLPELTLLEECPSYLAGVINMHGKIVPVVDLNRRFGHPPTPYSCSDRVIVLDVSRSPVEFSALSAQTPQVPHGFSLLGMIVNDVLDVLDIPEEDIEPPPFGDADPRSHLRFVSGEAKTGDGIVMILDSGRILEPEFPVAAAKKDEQSETMSQPGLSYFSPEAGPQEKQLFHNRAVYLQPEAVGGYTGKTTAVAVVSLNGEFLCLELTAVREFARIINFTPVPCCPKHIVGNMNLRGNVLTVIDIRGLLNIPDGKIGDSAKVVVADLGGGAVGLIVDDIVDVANLRETEIVAFPASMAVLNENFIKGAAPFAGKMAALLDLQAILAWDGLVVYEEV